MLGVYIHIPQTPYTPINTSSKADRRARTMPRVVDLINVAWNSKRKPRGSHVMVLFSRFELRRICR